ncbi:MAG: Holliday junction branch migration protein RuvA [Chloroflexi bacterium]|nr:Holliday junction branch migration protein RuvA [Chloroflexota bacterium]
MIAGLSGKLLRRGPDHAVIDVHGVHYRVSVSPRTLGALGAEGDEVSVTTYMYVREDNLQLFGFKETAEQDLFEQVLNVSGIGPKSALALVGSMAPAQLSQAIQSGNVDVLKRLPGIGVKTAQRLILELKGKLAPGLIEAAPAGSPQAELAGALGALGYSATEIASAVEYLRGVELPLEERLRRALRYFAEGSREQPVAATGDRR